MYFSGKRVAFLVSPHGVAELELLEPRNALARLGGEPVIVGLEPGRVEVGDNGAAALALDTDVSVRDVAVDDFDGLIVPGGAANCARVAACEAAVTFVRDFVSSGRPTAGICHAAWVFVAAGVVSGRQMTSWPGIRQDVVTAGGRWVDRRVVVDGNLVTSRMPEDIPAFLTQCAALLDR